MNEQRHVEIEIFLIMKDDESDGSIYTYLHTINWYQSC